MDGAMSVWWLDQRPGCDVQDRQALLDYLRNFNLAPRPVHDLASLDLPMMRRAGLDGVLLLFAFDADQPELHYCLRQARQHGLPAIVLLPAVSATERADLLERGADDCMSEPIERRELAARIHALRRRRVIQHQQTQQRISDGPLAGDHIRFGHWQLDTRRQSLSSPEAEVALSNAEYRLLLTFLNQPHQVFTRDRLMDEARGRGVDAFERSIDLLVSRLRHKLGDDPRQPALIQTVRGKGYLFAAAPA